MSCCIAELRNKEVICKSNGARLGNVDDVEIDIKDGRLVSIIIYGKGRMMGFWGKCEDITIPWCDIDVIGEDTILVNCTCPQNPPPPPRNRWQ
jgi:YlmC/YmxH family sporulation protein